MSELIFTSPGIKFKERDLSYVAKNVGITTLGLVGETLKGPAFEPILIQSPTDLRTRFGGQSAEKFSNGVLKYQLPYVANAYLQESNQLYVTRVLGVSGYDAGNAYMLTLSADADPSTAGTSVTGSTVTGVTFSGGSYQGAPISYTGQTGTIDLGKIKTGTTSFVGTVTNFIVTTLLPDGSGTVSTTNITTPYTSYTTYENMVLAKLRAKATVTSNTGGIAPTYTVGVSSISITGNTTLDGTGNFFGEFTITIVFNDGRPTTNTIVTLDPDAPSYILNIFGSTPTDKNTPIWVETAYPDLYRKLDSDGYAHAVNTSIIKTTTASYSDYNQAFQTPQTPWIVSEVRGSDINRLFKIVSISDGDSANKEIKISIQNIDPIAKEFDIIVRDFYDTDESISILESYSRCTMIKSSTNYIGLKIGTTDGVFPLKSKYIMIELSETAPIDAFPCGFEGYVQQAVTSGVTGTAVNAVQPKIYYKQSYGTTEKLSKTYLGISEKAYDGTSSKGKTINQNLFNYNGAVINTKVKTKGFHLDLGATGTTYMDGSESMGEFEVGVGSLRSVFDVDSSSDKYFDKKTRKFTLVPAGGFDGWNVYRSERTYGDYYKQGGIYSGVADNVVPNNDYQAWEMGIKTFSNPEEVTINIFATPGINWSNQNQLVKEALDMVEINRADSLYVIDAPDMTIVQEIGGERVDLIVANDIAGALSDAELDTSFAATYYPYGQLTDSDNNVNIFLPPTGEVMKAIAYNDKVANPWIAPAGLARGVTSFKKSKYKMSEEARGVLYSGRINPLIDFPGTGTAIFGQKTLQIKASKLDRINVRRLLLQMKVLISNIAIRLLFEQNDQQTIDQFITKLTPIMDTIKRERGISEYKINFDDTINSNESRDRNELYGEISIKPIGALEFIGMAFNITPTGASFSDLGL